MGDEDFKMAFAVSYKKREPKSDPRYINRLLLGVGEMKTVYNNAIYRYIFDQTQSCPSLLILKIRTLPKNSMHCRHGANYSASTGSSMHWKCTATFLWAATMRD